MGNKIAPMFNFEGRKVRVVLRGKNGDEPWFVAKDVRECLGISQSGSNFHFLNADEAFTLNRSGQTSGVIFEPRSARLALISESGLYKLVMRSDKPLAKSFQNWVTKEVLPAIRKDGMYVMGEEKVRTGELSEEEFILKAMTMLQGKVERLAEELAVTAKSPD